MGEVSESLDVGIRSLRQLSSCWATGDSVPGYNRQAQRPSGRKQLREIVVR